MLIDHAIHLLTMLANGPTSADRKYCLNSVIITKLNDSLHISHPKGDIYGTDRSIPSLSFFTGTIGLYPSFLRICIENTKLFVHSTMELILSEKSIKQMCIKVL